MIKQIFDYIVNIKLFDVPLMLAYLAISAIVAYCASLILIGVPCSIYESIAKKKVNNDKIIKIVAICLIVILYGRILYELATK